METRLKFTKVLTMLSIALFLAGCGGKEEEEIKTSNYVPTDWNNITFDWTPPSLIMSIRDSSGETGRPAVTSAYAIIASDEQLGTNNSGGPGGYYKLEGPGSSGGDVSFVDNTRTALRVNLGLRTEGIFTFSFEIPDARGNLARGSLQFATRGAVIQSGSSNPFGAYVDPIKFEVQNGSWAPVGSWYASASNGSYNFGTARGPSTSENPRGLPVFQPPLIMNRVRGPNYTWVYEYSYQYACPSGYYCPPPETVVTNPPVIPKHSLEGIAGAIIKICWELDCGGILGEALINRGIRAFVPRPGG